MKTLTILLIDEEIKRNRFLIKYLRENIGWDAYQTKTLMESINKLKEKPSVINCILLDIMMPIDEAFDDNEKLKAENGFSSGIVLLNKIVNITQHQIPIIIISARGNLSSLEDNQSVKAVLRKPIKIENLVELIKTISK